MCLTEVMFGAAQASGRNLVQLPLPAASLLSWIAELNKARHTCLIVVHEAMANRGQLRLEPVRLLFCFAGLCFRKLSKQSTYPAKQHSRSELLQAAHASKQHVS
jgi:hypothetical protein